ncbi:hypothetical protein [Bacillus sp. NEB1478]|uniref:hypothetical protein n=1 Tax=Bacillus sp. NEB1478 TaxID=3073816 RepID=UPI002873CD2D|nr:hypothetical protein [Bacillus sp. NEB1478]WNB92617.1 hypothetical protein RGB74_02815 [Bacillus sp. NEB1478]
MKRSFLALILFGLILAGCSLKKETEIKKETEQIKTIEVNDQLAPEEDFNGQFKITESRRIEKNQLGIAGKGANGNVTFSIIGDNGKILFENSVMPDENGEFSLKMGIDYSGSLTIKATSDGEKTRTDLPAL